MANVSPLEEAAISGDINRLYALIQVNPHVLEDVDAIPFVDTPLHISSSAGHLQFAAEIMRLKPSFAWKLNQQGFSPIHLALQHGHKRMVLRFVDINKDLVRVKGREGLTPLHFVSQIGDIDLLANFLSACPDSIEDVTVRSETALHIAVKYKQLEALQVLVGWLRRNTILKRSESKGGAVRSKRSILNSKDEAGNTILHISVLKNDMQALDTLINSKMMNLKAKNSENLTAFDIAATASTEIKRKLLKAGAKCGSSVEDDPNLAQKLGSKITVLEQIKTCILRIGRDISDISDQQRDAYLVVAALIITAIFQSALSPPGGVYQADSGANNLNATSPFKVRMDAGTRGREGKSVMTPFFFFLITGFNTMALGITILTTLVLMPNGFVGLVLCAATLCFSYSYLFSMWVISPTLATRYFGYYVMYGFTLIYVFAISVRAMTWLIGREILG